MCDVGGKDSDLAFKLWECSLPFSPVTLKMEVCYMLMLMCVCVCSCLQGNHQQQGEGDGGSGAQLRQLQPAVAQRGAGGAQQQHGGLPDRQVDSSHTHTLLFVP